MKKRFTMLLFISVLLSVIGIVPVYAKTFAPKAYHASAWSPDDVKENALSIKKGKYTIKIPSWKGNASVLDPDSGNFKTVSAKQSSVVFLEFKVPSTKMYTLTVDHVKYDKTCDFNKADGITTKAGTVTVLPQIQKKSGFDIIVGAAGAGSKKITYQGAGTKNPVTLFEKSGYCRFKAKKGSTIYFVVSSYAAKKCRITLR